MRTFRPKREIWRLLRRPEGLELRDLQCTGRLSVSLPQSSQHRVGTAASSVRLSCSAVEEREHDSEFLLDSVSRPLLLYCPSLALLLSKLEES
jgi:hypothetical protein